jgi:opacity protein-like surface antigen
MLRNVWSLIGAAVCLAALLVPATAADAEVRFKEGHWRLELSGGLGLDSGSEDRQGDVLIQGSAEYEFPATKRLTLGLRLLPIMVYTQDDESDGHHHHHWFDDDGRPDAGDTVVGGGFGFTTRIYQKAEEYRGLFFEVEGLALLHGGELDGNSSNFNFLTGAGLGYKFKNDWHTVLKFEHISNAGIGEHNRGTNVVSLGVGYSF